MMKMQSRKIWYYRITLIILLFAMLLAWALLPGVHEFINRSVAAFAAVDQQGIERFIQSYGALAAVVSFLLMILQAIAAPLPAFLITFANASLFGAFWGGLLSWTSSMAGAALCFFIARVMGREVVEKPYLTVWTAFSLATANTLSWSVGYCLLSLSIQSAMLPV